MEGKSKQEKKKTGTANSKKESWFSVAVIDDKYDGTGDDSLQIIEKARQLDIDTYRSQAQGSVFYYIHCTQSEADKLISTLGKDNYGCGILDESEEEVLKIINPQLVHKSQKKKSAEKSSKNDEKKTKSLNDQLQEAITEYNDAYTSFNDHGIRLLTKEKEQSIFLKM